MVSLTEKPCRFTLAGLFIGCNLTLAAEGRDLLILTQAYADPFVGARLAREDGLTDSDVY